MLTKKINEFLYSLVFNVVVDANEDMREGRTGGLDNETFNQGIEPWKDILETLSKQGEVIANNLT